jgi:hypothetical protein
MTRHTTDRRHFLRCTATGAVAGAIVPYWWTAPAVAAQDSPSQNDRPHVALIGAGGRGRADMRSAAQFGDIVAVCDVDRQQAERAKQEMNGKPAVFTDYRKLLERREQRKPYVIEG